MFYYLYNCNYILEAREIPIIPMLETIFYKRMERVDTKHKEAKWRGTICPKIRKKIEKYAEWSI
jgi:hypothetical protein